MDKKKSSSNNSLVVVPPTGEHNLPLPHGDSPPRTTRRLDGPDPDPQELKTGISVIQLYVV